MLSVQSSHSTAIFAFDPHDEVVIQGTAYRPLERRPEGYIFQRTDASGLAEVFDHGKLGHLVQKGQLVHNVGAFLPEEARRRLASTTCLVSAAPDAVSHRSKLRLAYVEAFLDLEALGRSSGRTRPSRPPCQGCASGRPRSWVSAMRVPTAMS